MLRHQFAYDLPSELIAQVPLEERAASQLLVVDGANRSWWDRQFRDIVEMLQPGDCLVMNDTRVIPARLLGVKDTGGQVELMLERTLGIQRALVQLRCSKPPRPGARLDFGPVAVRVVARQGMFFEVEFEGGLTVVDALQAFGSLPLPPYIKRSPDKRDATRYQTVYSRNLGAVAAPTAGLHFDSALLEALAAKGIRQAFVTLHVGAGTFQPVRVDNVADHRMHSEWVSVSDAACDAIIETWERGGRVIAVGTTVVRALESAARHGERLTPYSGYSDIFIYPGVRFRVIDGLVTNFHLPESTLLMLVCAFGGYDTVMAAYRHAVQHQYRFFSYGDAMLVWPAPGIRERHGNAI